MVPKKHILFGLIFSLVIALIFREIDNLEFLIMFLSTFLIDVDHYIYYIFKKRDLSFKNSIKYFFDKADKELKIPEEKRKNYYTGFYFLHGIEFLIILFILGIFVSKYFFMILIGISFHLFLDIYEEIQLGLRLDKISIIYDFIKFKKMKLID